MLWCKKTPYLWLIMKKQTLWASQTCQNSNNLLQHDKNDDNNEQKAVANCVWMLVVKIEGIERIY